jgi:hypothetical protein
VAARPTASGEALSTNVKTIICSNRKMNVILMSVAVSGHPLVFCCGGCVTLDVHNHGEWFRTVSCNVKTTTSDKIYLFVSARETGSEDYAVQRDC